MGNKTTFFKFADVEVREREFCLVKAGEVLPVEPKTFRVLLYLLRNPQKLIAKEELLNAVWGDAVVTDSSLTRTIAQLRRLLGDEIRNPRYIETVATVGYRWMCKIEVAMEPSKDDDKLAPDPIVPVAEEKNESKGLQSSRWAIPSAVVLAILILAGIWIVGHRKGTVSSIRSLAVIPLDNLSGDPRQEYFADGMSDELIAMLAKDSTLRITSRTSVMQFKGAHRPLQEIARALNVDAILEGINLALR